MHKLSNLDSLAVYFDTDAKSIAGLPYQESIDTFNKMVNNKFRRRTAILELTSKRRSFVRIAVRRTSSFCSLYLAKVAYVYNGI